jgi:hypothetical protein
MAVMTAGRTLAYAVLLTFWIVPASVVCAATSRPPSHCVFHRVDDHFGGSCGALFDQTPAMTLSPATRITTGVWRDDVHPASVWAGDMTDQGYRNAPLELIDVLLWMSSVRSSTNAPRRVTTITTSRTTTMILRHTLKMSRVSSKEALNRIEKP